MKRLIALVCAGLLLAGCGTTTTRALTVSWMKDANQYRGFSSLHRDVAKAVKFLEDPASTQADLHTLCTVLNLEIHAANDHLPTPDTQATSLLASGYDKLATATTQCDTAIAHPANRTLAITNFRRGYGDVYFGMIRLYRVLGRSGIPN